MNSARSNSPTRTLVRGEDLRHGVGVTAKTGTPESKDALDAIVKVTRALADAAKAGVQAMEAMQEFVEAHQQATDRGIGVTVVRQPDGSITTTPNVFVQAGTAVFMDSPAITNTLHQGYTPLHLVEDLPTAPPVYGEFFPSYTITKPIIDVVA